MNRLRLLPVLLCLTLPAFAGTGVNKDMVQLQTQIQQLQDAVARLQQSNDERMGVLKDLVQQSADSVNRMSVNMDALQKQISAQQAATGAKVDQVSGQVQALNDTLDEVKARIGRLEKALADVQGQQQSIAATLQNLPSSAVPAGTQPALSPGGLPAGSLPANTPPAGALTPSNAPAGTPLSDLTVPATPARKTLIPPARPTALPVEDLYKSAYSDYMAAKYPVAQAEFSDIIKNYPDNQLSGNSYYYLGEIDYRAGKYSAAARDYDKVLEQFPDSNKIPASHLHKGQALIEMKQTDAGIREFRALIQRFPTSPEATQARSKLNAMGVPIKPRA